MVLPTLSKQPWDDRLYDVVFDAAEFRTGEVLASVVSVTASSEGVVHGSGDVTVSGATHDSDRTVQFRLSGGTNKERYVLTIRASSNQSNDLEADVLLKVDD